MTKPHGNLAKFTLMLMLTLGAFDAVAADASGFMLDIAATGTEPEIQLTVPASGKVDFSLIQTNVPEPPLSISLRVSRFTGEEGNSVAVNLVVPGVSEAKPEHHGIKAANPVIPLELSVPKLPTAGKYRGTMILIAGEKSIRVWRIVLTRAAAFQPATLVLDQQAVSLEVTRPILGWHKDRAPECTVRIRERSGQWDLEGVDLRLEQVAKAPESGFDLRRNLDITCDDKPLPSSSVIPGNATDVIVPAGHQATVTMALTNLTPGEYNATLHFTAANSAVDDAQKLVMSVHVRDSVAWAVVVLIVALTISFLGTKVIGFLRARYVLLQRIHDLQGDWLREEPAILPVVWARAVLLQCEDLSRRFWLSGSAEINARVTQAASVVNILSQVHQIREELGGLRDHMIAYRAKTALGQIVCRLGAGAVDDESAARFKAELSALEDWLDATKVKSLYWKDVSDDIRNLLQTISLEEIPKESRITVQALYDKLTAALASPPADPATMIGKTTELDSDYARLKILWERHNWGDDFKRLIEVQGKQVSQQTFFDLADDLTWRRVKAACEDGRAQVSAPQSNGPEPFEAYDPLLFRLTTSDPGLDQTFLIWHGLHYKWTFTRTKRRHFGFSDTVQTFSIETDQPQIVDYAEDKGNLTVEVEIQRNADKSKEVKAPEPGLPIVESRSFVWLRGLESAEVYAFLLAAVVAIVTGLANFYFKGASFGASQDYLMLFLWGAGVDQTKNAIQILQTYSPSPTKV